MGKMDIKSNCESAEAQEVQQRSEFIKRVNDFARFMQKEYIEECDGELALMLCAMDKNVGDGKAGAAHIVLGGRMTMTAAVASMMQQDGMGEIFRVARMAAGEMKSEHRDIEGLRRKLRVGYGMVGLMVFWTLCLIGLQVWGVANWITTVSNLLLMVYLGYQLWHTIRDQRRTLKRIEEEEKNERRERLDRAMGMFSAMLKDIANRMNGDDDE